MRHSSIQLEVDLRSRLADLILIMGFQTSLLKEITNIDNDHLMIVNNQNDSLQIHFNDTTITCILHLSGQY